MKTTYSGKKPLLFLIPLYIIVLSFIFLKKFSPFYLNQPDPCYCYLFNGMNLASGHMEIGHIDHPGTTVQCFTAIIIFIQHLFSFSAAPLYQDVIINSESYLYTCSIVLILLFVFANYYTGTYIYKHTGNIITSLLFQIIPLININILQRALVLGPESLIIIIAPFFMAYLYVNIVKYETGIIYQYRNKHIFIFALLSGFLIASKYTSIPVVILVLFVLRNSKQRLLYVGMVILSFLFFIIPALPKMKSMYYWVWNLFMHDGVYGKGNEKVIDTSVYLKNMKDIFLTDTVFTFIYLLITFAFLIAFVNRIRTKQVVPFFPLLSGLWVSITLLILMVAKHCDFHYLIFAECCYPLGLVISFKVLSPYFKTIIQNIDRYEKGIIYSVFSIFILFLVIEKIRYIPLTYSSSVGTNIFPNYCRDMPLIVSIQDGLGCDCKEPALYLGYIYSGDMKDTYASFLKDTYPNTYIYWNNSPMITHWDKTISINDFVVGNKKILLYLKGYDNATQINLIHKFSKVNTGIEAEQHSEQEIFEDGRTLQNVCVVNNSIQ